MSLWSRAFLIGLLAGPLGGPTVAHPNDTTSPPSATEAHGYAQTLIGLREVRRNTSDTQRLHQLMEAHWAWLMEVHPAWATYAGWPGPNDRWTDQSLGAIAARQDLVREARVTLGTIRREKLSPEDQLNHDLFQRGLDDEIAGFSFPDEVLALNQMGGVQQEIPSTLASQPASSVADYEAILRRLERAPTLITQTQALLEEGLRRGVTPPAITLRGVLGQVDALLTPDTRANPLLAPFRDFPEEVPEAERARLSAAAEAHVRERVQPAFQRLRAFLADTYIPAARPSIALSALPDGDAWYRHRVRHFTTTSLSPDEIHDLGLAEVARIRKEMEKILVEVGYSNDFTGFCEFLRTDPRFFYDSPEALLAGYRDISKRIDPQLVQLFGTLPRLTYGVEPIPDYAAPNQTTAYYQQGSPQAGRPGTFFANTYDLKSRPRWEMEALTLHEAVPGHHLQISLAQELTNLPTFRRQEGWTAFVEGWALYAESLGPRMGLFADPYSRFGQLGYEMWRAIRLVVDTGMHHKGWTREQALAFFRANSSKPDHDIEVEIDRYIAWPGQALAYKIGALKIQELRRRAEAQLGPRFDIRAFHDAVLSGGALPLDLLEARIDAWIQSQGTSAGGTR